jgi:4-aminobutyrate aminotransferase-like enzyme
VRDDVNLIDVLDMIVDCVMAGMGRTGSVYPLEISQDVLKKAFDNTVTLLKNNVTVED